MKKLLTIFILILSIKGFSQDNYFLGKTNYCTPEKGDSKEMFQGAMAALNFPKYYTATSLVLLKTIKEDPKYCDAYFLAGYYLRLQNLDKEALIMYYTADSLAQNKAPIFKQNLAVQYMKFGQVKKARNKYEEMIKYFPGDPEGYYGVANTSLILEDYDDGLVNLKKAEERYGYTGTVKSDVKYLYGALYCLKEKYDEALPYLDEVYSVYKKDDHYLALYALTQIKSGKRKNDEKLIKKARKSYEKIKDKNILENISKKLKEEFS
ncbi:hypothetical protein EG359_03765 [Chryseobacterium joostei]|uniref:Uncharacterized protein n=1 Tax=Chryseobacterium joostei TaxID=112234 RepID=A0A1N7HX71_9FLAO|nr:hypothetical protein [Chryseobacterium joostei]AZA98777.1 hypothetical protein EG359_03765 [Chryseobacterium joostei]SIS29437.1 hypothetical protein SAMN05421768_101609 [Chryseobacterium joostei]